MKKKNQNPPVLATWILAIINRAEDRSSVTNDFTEMFNELARKEGRSKAVKWYWFQVLRSLPMFFLNQCSWGVIMIKNYFKITLRHLLKNKGYSFINISGLAIGMACCLLITLWILDELSVDRFHKEPQSICHVLVHTDVKNNSTTQLLLGPTLKQDFAEIVDFTRYHWMFGTTAFSYKDRFFNENGLRIVDPSFFQIFNFPFLKGNPETAFDNPHSVVITEFLAEKYFGHEEPMGKILTMNREHKLTVTGVVKNVPHNSTIQFDMLIPMELKISITGEWYTDWSNLFTYTFIKLDENYSPEEVAKKIAGVIQQHGGAPNAILDLLSFKERYFRFYSDKMYIYIFLTIAIFILIIACFNFVNLSTARSAKRAREIGMRKTLGARRKNIISQFLGESFLFSFIAMALAFLLITILLPLFNSLTGKEINISWQTILPLALGLALFTGLAAGSYPAIFLSSFQPVRIMRENLKSGSKGGGFRKILVVIQFSLSIILIIGMFVVYRQIGYIKGTNIGYNREHIISIAMGGGSEKYFHPLKNELLRGKEILSISGTCASLPYFHWHLPGFRWKEKDPGQKISISYNGIDYDFIKTMKIKLLEGRDFSREYITDKTNAYLINQEMQKLMKKKSALGAWLQRGDESSEFFESGTIIGIMENFHFNSLQNQIEPLVLKLEYEGVDNMLIRIQPGDISAALSFIEKKWEKILPGYPLEFSFLDEDFNKSYQDLERTGSILNSFAILAIIISCLGLLGLASFTVEERTKEIGIRKVLGSSATGIVWLLSKDFSRCMVIAIGIAWPFSYWIMKQWLQNFAYRTTIGFLTFILSAVLVIVIGLITISYQSIKAALANPVHSLRCE